MDGMLIIQLRDVFNNLGRGTSGRLIIETYEEEVLRDIIEKLFANELAKEE